MSRWGLPARRAAMGSVLCSLFAQQMLLTHDARAEDDDDEPPPLGLLSPEPEPLVEGADGVEGAAAEKAAEPAAPPAPAAAAPSATSFLGVELLTAEAYPAPEARGIPGGSLFATTHGLHWPYLPAQPGRRTRVALSGLAWVDTSYRSLAAGEGAADPDAGEWEQKARFVLRATPTYSAPGNWFVQGQAELVLLGSTPTTPRENLGVDDLYLRVGRWHAFDLTVGRFQGWEVYHLGMGLDQNTSERRGASTAQNPALDIGTDLQFSWERADGPGNVAVHIYPVDFFRFELLGRVGGAARNQLGVRPTGIFDFGIIKAKIAGDYLRESPREQLAERKDRTIARGVVGALQLVLEPVLEAGIAGGYALVDDYTEQGALNAAGSNTTYSFGGFANVQVTEGVVLGAGGLYTNQHNLEVDATGSLNDIEAHTQVFGAAQYALWDQLYIKAVFAYARALFDPQSDPMPLTFRNESLSGRIRLAYAF